MNHCPKIVSVVELKPQALLTIGTHIGKNGEICKFKKIFLWTTSDRALIFHVRHP